jgi:hypothetical protein
MDSGSRRFDNAKIDRERSSPTMVAAMLERGGLRIMPERDT